MKKRCSTVFAALLMVCVFALGAFCLNVRAKATTECTGEHQYDNACDGQCNVCDYTRTTEGHKVAGAEILATNAMSYPFSYDNGIYSSTNKTSSSTATFKVEVLTDGPVTIYYYTSTESDYDKLQIKKNTETVLTKSGETAWEAVTISAVDGDYIYITYSKDGSVSQGEDTIRFRIETERLASDVEPTCTEDVVCSECGVTVKEATDHSYTDVCDTTCNNGCGTVRTAPHSYTDDCDEDCNLCGTERTVTHTYSSDCDTICNECEQIRYAYYSHTYSNVCDATCNDCGHTRIVDGHKVSTTVVHTISNDANYPFSLSGDTYQSTNKSDSSSATFTYTFQGSGAVTFRYYTSTESRYDVLTIKHNSTTKVTASGSTSWETITINVVAGDKVHFNYTKDRSYYSGSDTIYFKLEGSQQPASEVAPTCTQAVVCSACNTTVKQKLGHSFTNACDTTCNRCNAKRTIKHTYTNTCDTTCNVCNAKRTVKHTYSNTCDTTCNVCNAKRTIKHTYSNTCDTTCNMCNAKRTIKHTYSNNCDKSCNVCKATRKVGSHKYSAKCDTTCNYCGAKRSTKHTYSNACDTSCNVCKEIRKVPHQYKNVVKKATLKANGTVTKKCTLCGHKASTTTVSRPKTFKLSDTSFAYNGKAQKPTVTVKDAAGKTLKNGTDYTVSYQSGRKNVGTYKVTVKFKGKYSGTKTLTFSVKPTVKTSASLWVGGTSSIGAKSNTTVKYKSSDKSVATVNSKGVITAKKAGTATITVTSGKVSQKITVKVTKPSIKISAPKSTIENGETLKFTATTKKPSSAKVTWSVSNKKLASISSSGVLTPKGCGQVKVTGQFKYKGKTYKSTFTVTINAEYPDVSVFISQHTDYTDGYAFILDNEGDAPLKVLNRGYVYCYGNSENIKSLFVSGSTNFYSSVTVDAGESLGAVAVLEDKMLFWSDERTSLYIYVEYRGETFRLECSTSKYGINKCSRVVWMVKS